MPRGDYRPWQVQSGVLHVGGVAAEVRRSSVCARRNLSYRLFTVRVIAFEKKYITEVQEGIIPSWQVQDGVLHVAAFHKSECVAFAHAATICAPQGHSLGGRMPDTHSFACGNGVKIFKYDCPTFLAGSRDGISGVLLLILVTIQARAGLPALPGLR